MQFASHFIGGHMYKKSTTCLMSIRQRKDETLRFYIALFNKESLSIVEADDKILAATFTIGLRKRKFLFSLYKNDSKTMSDVLYQTTKYMNTKDALLAQEERPKKRDKQEDAQQERGRKTTRAEDRREDRHSKLPTARFTNFTPLTTPMDQVLMQIKDNTTLTWPGKLKGDPNRRSKDKYYCFHRDHGHNTYECYDLK